MKIESVVTMKTPLLREKIIRGATKNAKEREGERWKNEREKQQLKEYNRGVKNREKRK